MKRSFIYAFVTALTLFLAIHAAAQSVSESELRYREAVRKQQVDGDLPAAIKMYLDIAASKTADRATKAKALLQLAACYETLGRETQAVYQRIVRDFNDQPAATQARAKLAAAARPDAGPARQTLRKIELGPGVDEIAATDGQRAVYWETASKTLFIGDLSGKDRKKILQSDRHPRTIVSRDLSMVFFMFPTLQQQPATYAVMKTDGTGYHELSLTENGQTLTVTAPACATWSWDNRYLLMCKVRADRVTHLLKISVADGTFQDVLPGQNVNVGSAEFSPDGRYIAYNEGAAFGSVHIISSQGGEPRTIADAGLLADWSRDGRFVMFGEQRDGSLGLSAVPVQNGQPTGPAVFIRSSLPVSIAPRTMPNGSMIVTSGGGPTGQVSLAALDSQDILSSWKTLELVGDGGGAYPSWSPDGRQFVYIAGGAGLSSTGGVVRIRNVADGGDRELYRSNGLLLMCLWARQHPVVYCDQIAGRNSEILAVSLETGRAEKIGILNGTRILHRVSPDDRVLYTASVEEGLAGKAWEIGTDRETNVINPTFQSDDGRWTFCRSTAQDVVRGTRIRPTSGTDADCRLVLSRRVQGPTGANPVAVRFTESGNWIVYHDKDSDGKDGLYRVATSEGEPQRLGAYPTDIPSSILSISPDGRQFIVVAPGPPKRFEYWMLENFLPPTAGTKVR